MKLSFKHTVLTLIICITSVHCYSQQDPQFTQYMYNTLSVNPGYAGSRGHLTINGLARTQWVGIEGAPDTQTFSFHSPVGYGGLNLGLNVINDELGPAQETYFDVNAAYGLPINDKAKLALGMKVGGRLFNVDWSKGRFQNPDVVFQQNIVNEFLPTIGAGLYYYTDRYYLGVSVPNFINSEHYDDAIESLATERTHFFFIGGYVFDLNTNIKFKPAFLVRAVSGAPVIADVSANFLFYERFALGAAWRWDDSISALAGFQISESLNIGYAYDLTTTGLRNYNSGNHEILLKFEIFNKSRLKSPRFF